MFTSSLYDEGSKRCAQVVEKMSSNENYAFWKSCDQMYIVQRREILAPLSMS